MARPESRRSIPFASPDRAPGEGERGAGVAPRATPGGRNGAGAAHAAASAGAGRAQAGPSDLEYAREVVRAEGRTLLAMAERLDDGFVRAVELVLTTRGRVVTTGMGKPGLIAQKVSATLASTGTPSFYLHPAEAVHGDLGRLATGDLVLAFSNSGETEEVVRLLPSFRRIGAKLLAVTGDPESPLASSAEVVLSIGRVHEACPLGMAPTASSAALLAMGDALAMAILRHRDFDVERYAALHPGGDLGRRFLRVREIMRTGEAMPTVGRGASLLDAVRVMTNTIGRPGAALVVNEEGLLQGIFTDGDLRRLIERGETDFARPVASHASARPRCLGPDDHVEEAAVLLRAHHIDQAPVVDADGRAVGLIDVQDILDAGVPVS